MLWQSNVDHTLPTGCRSCECEGVVPDFGYGGNSPLKYSLSRTWTNRTPADGYTLRSPCDLDKMVTTETQNGNDFLRAEPLPFYKSIMKASAAALIRTEEKALIEVRTNKEPCYERHTSELITHTKIDVSTFLYWHSCELTSHTDAVQKQPAVKKKNYDYVHTKRRKTDFRGRGVRNWE